MSLQYRDALTEYTKSYSVLVTMDTKAAQITWSTIDAQEFLPKAEWLVFTRYILWNRYKDKLKTELNMAKELIDKLKEHNNTTP